MAAAGQKTPLEMLKAVFANLQMMTTGADSVEDLEDMLLDPDEENEDVAESKDTNLESLLAKHLAGSIFNHFNEIKLSDQTTRVLTDATTKDLATRLAGMEGHLKGVLSALRAGIALPLPSGNNNATQMLWKALVTLFVPCCSDGITQEVLSIPSYYSTKTISPVADTSSLTDSRFFRLSTSRSRDEEDAEVIPAVRAPQGRESQAHLLGTGADSSSEDEDGNRRDSDSSTRSGSSGGTAKTDKTISPGAVHVGPRTVNRQQPSARAMLFTRTMGMGVGGGVGRQGEDMPVVSVPSHPSREETDTAAQKQVPAPREGGGRDSALSATGVNVAREEEPVPIEPLTQQPVTGGGTRGVTRSLGSSAAARGTASAIPVADDGAAGRGVGGQQTKTATPVLQVTSTGGEGGGAAEDTTDIEEVETADTRCSCWPW